MSSWPLLPAWLALHLAIGIAGTWLARRYALRRNLLDQPGERRSHALPTPRGGGISIVAAVLAGLAVTAFRMPESGAAAAAGAAGLLLVAGIGWVDDHRPLSPWLRLAVHVLAAALLALALHLYGAGALPVGLAFAAAVVLVNVWNFMDGIDGLAASQAALVAVAYALAGRSGAAVWLGVGLAAAVCGFLPFNFPRARIFLGDVGSGALGYALAGLLGLAAGARQGQGTAVLLLALPLSVFMIDASLTLAARMLRGERWWTPHVQHAYQRWSRLLGSHRPVTLAYATATAVMVLLMLGARSWDSPFIIVMMSACWLAGGATWFGVQAICRRRDPGIG